MYRPRCQTSQRTTRTGYSEREKANGAEVFDHIKRGGGGERDSLTRRQAAINLRTRGEEGVGLKRAN